MAESITDEQLPPDDSKDSPVSKSQPGPLAFLDTPEGRKLAYHKTEGVAPGVVYIHGLGSDMNGEKALALEEYCRSNGRSYLRFELSGHGQSSEQFTESNVSMWLEDLNAVLQSLSEGPQILVGSSIGGWLMFLYTMRYPEKVHGLIGVATAPDFTQKLWKDLDKETRQEVKRSGIYKLSTPHHPESYEVTMQLIQDGDKYSILDMPGIEYIKAPTWLFHGEQDAVVPASTSMKLMQMLQCPVSLKTVEDGDHRLSRPQDIKLIIEALTELFSPDQTVEQDD